MNEQAELFSKKSKRVFMSTLLNTKSYWLKYTEKNITDNICPKFYQRKQMY